MIIREKGGVTLIEVMVVVAIVGMLAAIAIPAYNDYVTRSRRSDAFTALETVRAAQEMYRAEKGFYASDFVDGGVNVLAGCSTIMAGDNYTIENLIRGDPPTTYTIEATAKNKQTDDHSFRIDQDGDKEYNDGPWNPVNSWEDIPRN